MRYPTLLILLVSAFVSTSVVAEPFRQSRPAAPRYQPPVVRYAPPARPAPQVVVRHAPAPVVYHAPVYHAPAVVYAAPRVQYYGGHETNHAAALVVGTVVGGVVGNQLGSGNAAATIGGAVVGGLLAHQLTR